MRGPRKTWLFDLDNTLHHATPHIFPHINRSMTAYIERHLGVARHEATRIRQDYWLRYGATLLGLVRHHGTDPDHFLQETHQFPDLERMVVFERPVIHALRRLPGRKIIFSNAPRHYTEAILAITGLGRCFDAIYSVENVRYQPKPICHSPCAWAHTKTGPSLPTCCTHTPQAHAPYLSTHRLCMNAR